MTKQYAINKTKKIWAEAVKCWNGNLYSRENKDVIYKKLRLKTDLNYCPLCRYVSQKSRKNSESHLLFYYCHRYCPLAIRYKKDCFQYGYDNKMTLSEVKKFNKSIQGL